MANLTISLSHDYNQLILGSNKHFDKLYNEFENKWVSILSLFEDKFLINNHVIADSSGVEIYTSNFPTLDDNKPNYDRAVCRFLAAVNPENEEVAWGTGQEPFPEGFYTDLYNILAIYDELTTFNLSFEDSFPPELSEKINLINSESKEEGCVGFLCGQVDINGDEGYYSLSVELNREGVVLNSDYYESADEDYY